jgi:hypothetical protein
MKLKKKRKKFVAFSKESLFIYKVSNMGIYGTQDTAGKVRNLQIIKYACCAKSRPPKGFKQTLGIKTRGFKQIQGI